MRIKVTAFSEGGKGLSGYRIYNSDELIYETEVGDATINIACFLGICHALHKFPKETIYSNNKSALSWVREKKCNTYSELLFHRVEKAEKWLETLSEIKIGYEPSKRN